jgi:bifunctional DNA primase/polymerase-like protein/primase-like protein
MQPAPNSKLARSALWYAKHLGWAVFPLATRSKLPGIPEKFGGRGLLDATRALEQIGKWWTINPDYNIGIATGEPSGIFVLDIDAKRDGEDMLAQIIRQNGDLPPTLLSRTGGGGLHYIFRHTAGIRNSASKIGNGLDIRGDGGYIVAPPSIHESGRPYAWDVDHHPQDAAIAEAPQWLIDLIHAKSANGKGKLPEEWAAFVNNGVKEGARNESVASLAGHLLRHFVDPRVTLDLLMCWNSQRCRPPLDEDEIVKTVASVCRKEEVRRAEVRQ